MPNAQLEMRVLSLWQPWATLWLADLKQGETRHFLNRFTGTIVIHATKYIDNDVCRLPVFAGALRSLGYRSSKQLPVGAAIGTCNLLPGKPVESVRNTVSDREFAFGNFENGRYWWPADHKEAFAEPIELKGQQSVPWIWRVPAELESVFDFIRETGAAKAGA